MHKACLGPLRGQTLFDDLRHRLAGPIQADAITTPQLWTWVLLGGGLDACVLAFLWPATDALLPAADYLVRSVLFGLVLMTAAWLVHVMALPALLRVPAVPSWLGLTGLILRGTWYLGVAGLLAVAAGCLSFILALPVEDALFRRVHHALLFTAVPVATHAAGGAAAGGIGHLFRISSAAPRAGNPWRAATDILGAMLAAGLAVAGTRALDTTFIGAAALRSEAATFLDEPQPWSVLHSPVLPVPLGTLVLLPHLFLLGLDLRRAARPTFLRTSPATPSTPPL